MSVFLSTPSARRATQGLEQYNRHNQNFYPRPLRGGRRENGDVAHHTVVISIHALCEEGDLLRLLKTSLNSLFLSTPSARRATPRQQQGYFRLQISIHALCEEGDDGHPGSGEPDYYFYPRPLRGGRLSITSEDLHCIRISIHALCEEGDSMRHRYRLSSK